MNQRGDRAARRETKRTLGAKLAEFATHEATKLRQYAEVLVTLEDRLARREQEDIHQADKIGRLEAHVRLGWAGRLLWLLRGAR